MKYLTVVAKTYADAVVEAALTIESRRTGQRVTGDPKRIADHRIKPYGVWKVPVADDHAQHADFIDVDCSECRAEAEALGMGHRLPEAR